MNLRLATLNLHLPKVLKLQKLRSLFAKTAEAFGTPMPAVDGFTFDETLRAYAIFTREESLWQLSNGNRLSSLQKRLFEGAYALGKDLRDQLKVRTLSEALRAARIIYRAIGIDLRGNERGEITVRSCFFSRYYSAEVCRLISALDEGLIAGLSDGGRLSFFSRITEGKGCCLAVVNFEETHNEEGNRRRLGSRRCDRC